MKSFHDEPDALMRCGVVIKSAFAVALSITVAQASVPTAEEYAHSLENRFLAGEPSASIRASFETNGLYTFYEIMPYCYDYAINPNDLEGSVRRYRRKHEFIDALLPRGPIEVSSNVLERTVKFLEEMESALAGQIYARYSENPTPESKEYWNAIFPRAFSRMYSGPLAKGFWPSDSRMFIKDAHGFVQRIPRIWPKDACQFLLEMKNYVFSKAELYEELSTNTQFNADELLTYCLTEKGDFATNNIAIAEKQIWRNNFVLEIVRHSCNLHTNAANRALDTAYTNKLAAIRAHYDAMPAPHLGMAGAELAEWRSRLGATIDAYTNSISPFRGGESGD